ncbi:3-oxoadipate enol-lactonase [Martelella alba]|uniref:3-oxoadipate enol-lactonase n=1 Tax=Martelella alba TaxID=2590451 RepID=A0A506U932_9HYPH|nr:3-oxoadipate enol-lactonase [Martelella alba]TPW30942.1 3-oxoadipate enol-lactonase [Martelella alba]
MQFVRLNAVTLHYRLHGDPAQKPLIVLINSLGTDLRLWDYMIPYLAEHFSFLTYDKRGHGLSDLGETPQSIDDHADDLIALLDHLSLKPAFVCGLSVGGLIAHALWARRPDLVPGLVLSNTASKIGTQQSWNERISLLNREGIAGLVDVTMERWFTAAFRRPDNAVIAGLSNMLVRQSLKGYVATCAAIRDADYRDVAPTITVPVLCLVGDEDSSTPPEVVKETANAIPGAAFTVIAGAGHIPCVERPEFYAGLLVDFAKRHDLAG